MGQRKKEPSKWCDEKDPTNNLVLTFIQDYLSDAQEVAKGLGIEVEWLLGLAAAESGYGMSNIARNAKNFFGQNQNASGRIGRYQTNKGVFVAKFKDFKSSARSFASDFGNLVRGKKTAKDFVNSLVPKFNTTDPKTNGNPKFREDTLGGVKGVIRRMSCPQLQKHAHKCGAACGGFEKYGYCDRLTKNARCWQHS